MTEMIPENEKVPEVFVYRLQAVEGMAAQINLKLDTFISAYPTKEHLDLVLKPFELRLIEVEKEQAEQSKTRTQVKLLVMAAFLNPIALIILSIFVQKSLQ